MSWILCELTESMLADDAVKPDWSRVPEAKRTEVQARWRAKNEQQVSSTVYLWEAQIPFFRRFYKVEVRHAALTENTCQNIDKSAP